MMTLVNKLLITLRLILELVYKLLLKLKPIMPLVNKSVHITLERDHFGGSEQIKLNITRKLIWAAVKLSTG